MPRSEGTGRSRLRNLGSHLLRRDGPALPLGILFLFAVGFGFAAGRGAAGGASLEPPTLRPSLLEESAQQPRELEAAQPVPPTVEGVEALAPTVIAAVKPEPVKLPERVVSEGVLGKGETLARALHRHGVSSRAVHLIATEMTSVLDFRYAQPRDRFRLEQEHDGTVASFRYERSPLEHYTLHRIGEGYFAARYEADFARRKARIAGVVATSLYDAIDALGERPELAHDFASIFAWDVDFTHSVHPGDEFSIVYERLHAVGEGEERYVRPGRILAARYSGRDGEFRAVYFEIDESRGGYYRLDGTAVERQFLKAPLQYQRISSAFSLSRLHPILKVRRPHAGIDYAAPTGTPVWSVADGTVIHRGRAGGFGNLVKVRHAKGWISYYGHLSRFASGLRVGSRIGQKQVIGYVGSTGYATGPHLDFRLRHGDRFVNPAALRSPSGPPIPESMQARFEATRDALLAQLDPTPLVVVNEAL